MRRKRKTETAEERSERLKLEAQLRIEAATAADQDLDAVVRRSIELYGP